MKYYLITIFLFLSLTQIFAQDNPSGYTPNYGLRKWSQNAIPSADSLNKNWTDIDSYIKIRDQRIDSLRNRTINGQPLSANVSITKATLGIDTTKYLDAINANSGTLNINRLPTTVYNSTTGNLDTSKIVTTNQTETITGQKTMSNAANAITGYFTGYGKNIDSLVATKILTGTLDTGRLSSMVYKTNNLDTSKIVMTDQSETITGTKAFSSVSTKALWSTVEVVTTNIDWSLSNTFSKTLSSSPTLTFSNTQAGQMITIAITNGASWTITWPTITWMNGVVPVQTPSKTDIYSFIKIGSIIYGTAAQNF